MLHNPPVHLSAPSTGSWLFTGLCVAIFAGALAWSLVRAGRGDWLAVACLLGGLVANLIEAMLDHLGLLWFASNNHLVLFHEFGGAMPLYVVLGYGFYFGAITYFTLYSLRNGKGSHYLWGIYAAALVFDGVLEITGGEIGIYRYYGPQPFRVLTEPLWWLFINPALPIAAGGLFHVMRARLRGWRALSIAALLPIVYGATYGATAWPIFIAFHTSVPDWVIWAAAVATDAFALLFVALIIAALEWYRQRVPTADADAVAAPAPASAVPAAAGTHEPVTA
jgi:hypothetical protein